MPHNADFVFCELLPKAGRDIQQKLNGIPDQEKFGSLK